MKKFEMKIGKQVYTGLEYEPAPLSMAEPPVLPSPDSLHRHPGDRVVLAEVDLIDSDAIIIPAANGDIVTVHEFELPHPVIVGPKSDEAVPGCSLSEGDLDEESIAKLEGEGFIRVYPEGRIQIVSEAHPVDAMIARVDTTFRVLDRVMPKRLVDEEIGDALEAMHRIANDPRHRFPRIVIGFRFALTLICVAFHCIRFISASVLGKKTE